MTARRAAVGDRLRVTCTDTLGATVTAVVVVAQLRRLGCGCDRVTASRPGPEVPDGCPLIELVPQSCHHTTGGVDFDQARAAARQVPA